MISLFLSFLRFLSSCLSFLSFLLKIHYLKTISNRHFQDSALSHIREWRLNSTVFAWLQLLNATAVSFEFPIGQCLGFVTALSQAARSDESDSTTCWKLSHLLLLVATNTQLEFPSKSNFTELPSEIWLQNEFVWAESILRLFPWTSAAFQRSQGNVRDTSVQFN